MPLADTNLYYLKLPKVAVSQHDGCREVTYEHNSMQSQRIKYNYQKWISRMHLAMKSKWCLLLWIRQLKLCSGWCRERWWWGRHYWCSKGNIRDWNITRSRTHLDEHVLRWRLHRHCCRINAAYSKWITADRCSAHYTNAGGCRRNIGTWQSRI